MKRIVALFAAAVAAAACLSVFSGCSAEVGYVLKTDSDGSNYYSASVTGYPVALKGELAIPETYGEGEEKFPVKEIETSGFANTNLEKVIIPASVEKIGSAAFAYNSRLKQVEFAEGSHITELPRGMFGYCMSLTDVNIPQTVKSVGVLAFGECSALESVTLPAGLETISANAFESCTALRQITLPEGLRTIGELAFYTCTALERIELPASLAPKEVKYTAEDGTEATATVPALGNGAFHTCTALKSAVVRGDIGTLGSGVFGYCTALEEVYLPSGIVKIEGVEYSSGGSFYLGHTFHNCAALKKVYFAGTEAEWSAIEIDNQTYSANGATYDNSAVINAEKVYNTAF